MTPKSCAVEMRNAILRNYLNAVYTTVRRVAEVFGRVFVLTAIFIKRGLLKTSTESASLQGVWGHAPPPGENFEI